MSIRIVIVDNQAVVRRGLMMFLQTDADLEIVGEASNGREALLIALDRRPDVILMDLLMPIMNGVAATTAILEHTPDVDIIALSSSTDYALITAAVLAGVSTYLHKDSKPDQLINTIKGIAAGRVLLAPALIDNLLNDLPALTPTQPLTAEEIMLVHLLAAQNSDDEIARQFQTDTAAIRSAVKRIQGKLSSDSRLLAVIRAMQFGIVGRPSPL
jgi:two-component system, NarL family, response regulator LiaR